MLGEDVTGNGDGAAHRTRRGSGGRRWGRGPRVALRTLAFAATLALAGPLAADDENTKYDGLDQALREVLYNSTTSLVGRLDLPQLSKEALLQMFYGAFEPDALAVMRGQKDFDKSVEDWIKGPSLIASGLVGIKYKSLTLVVSQYYGSVVSFGVLSLGFNLDDFAWFTAKELLEGVFKLGGFNLALSRRGDYVVMNAAGDTLTGVDYSSAVKDTVLLGLAQPSGKPAFAFVAPINNDIRDLLAGISDYGNIGPALAKADYIGGYVVSGSRPEVHVYVRFASEKTATDVKAAYDAASVQQIAKADQADKDEAEGKALHMVSMITGGEFERRMQRATAMTVFGNVLRLDLDTTDLRTITGAFIDRYMRKPPDAK